MSAPVSSPPSDPVLAQPKPYLVALEAGRTYFWCACGRSARQPFCDGSHQGTPFQPRKFVAERSEEVLLCGCKRTRGAPFCDGAHAGLPGGSPLDDPQSPANRAIALVTRGDDARSWLDGGCYVAALEFEPRTTRGALRYCYPVTAELGARFQSQTLLEVEDGASPVLSFGARESILFVMEGSGRAIVSGRPFALAPTDGLYVRPGESLELIPADGRTLKVFALASPPGELEWPQRMADNFDDAFPERVAAVDAQARVAMGPRYFQLLVDKRLGSRVITQFIGHIPRSKAAPHRHLYEETLIVLTGAGYLWTEARKAAVGAGDVIFLPRKQLHSLEASSADGMQVVGVICPGDNPSISF
jgi:CDGSH-type Zn-finger protein/mannose-6-phosphate isomerase-like protein (cupin superfamily)